MKMDKKITAVDLFYERVLEMLARKRPMTTNEAALIHADCKEMQKEQIMEAYAEGMITPVATGIYAKGYDYYKKIYEEENNNI